MSGTAVKQVERFHFVQFNGRNANEILQAMPRIREYQITKSSEGVKFSALGGADLELWDGDFLMISSSDSKHLVVTPSEFRESYELESKEYGNASDNSGKAEHPPVDDLALRNLALAHAITVNEHHSETIARANAYLAFLKGSAK